MRDRMSAPGVALGAAALAMLVSACSAPSPTAGLKNTKEHFPESVWGKASPRVAKGASGLPRGGGRYQVGNAYQIRGQWYQPKEDPDYVAEGKASWYGSAFHGRLTANGEVYDMTHLTAAHPTLPLPSYARVTNVENGNTLVVRINDRGPFAANRIIDLSKRAAELLEYKNAGVARVRVEYLGPAPLHGQDDSFLMASYRPGSNGAPDPADSLPDGVMLAMNAPTPQQPMPTALNERPANAIAGENVMLPAVGPYVPDRPGTERPSELALLSYADQRVHAAAHPAAAILANPHLDAQRLATWWAEREGWKQGLVAPFINLGAWPSRDAAEKMAAALSAHGRITVEAGEAEGRPVYALMLVPHEATDPDAVLRAAWEAGAVDAFAVRE